MFLGGVENGRMRCVVLAAVAVLMAGPAFAQIESREGIALENEILELRQELQQLQQLQNQAAPQPQPPQEGQYAPPPQQEGGPPPSGDIVAQLLVRVSALEEQMRALQGKVEELSNTEQHDHDDLAKQIGDLAFKLNPNGAPPAAGQASPDNPDNTQSVPSDMSLTPTPTPTAPPPTPHRTAEQSLRLGNAALARRDYDSAAAAAQEVLAQGRGPRATDAQFLLARANAGKHNYKEAAAAYYAVYKAAPKSPRAAESLVGVGNAFLGMGDKPHACETLVKFKAEFPHADAGLRSAAASVRKRAGC